MQLQEHVEGALAELVDAGRLPGDARVQLVWDGGRIYAAVDPPVLEVDISGGLEVPPL